MQSKKNQFNSCGIRYNCSRRFHVGHQEMFYFYSILTTRVGNGEQREEFELLSNREELTVLIVSFPYLYRAFS